MWQYVRCDYIISLTNFYLLKALTLKIHDKCTIINILDICSGTFSKDTDTYFKNSYQLFMPKIWHSKVKIEECKISCLKSENVVALNLCFEIFKTIGIQNYGFAHFWLNSCLNCNIINNLVLPTAVFTNVYSNFRIISLQSYFK